MGPGRLDLRLAPSAVLAWAVSLSAAYLPSLWTGAACAALLGAACLLLTTRAVAAPNRRSFPATLAVACLFGAAVAAHAAMDAGLRDGGPVADAAAARDSVVMNLLIVGEPRDLGTDSRGSGRWAVPAEVVDIAANGMLIRSRARILLTGGEGWDKVVTGQEVRTAGKLKPAKPGQVEAGVLAAATPPMQPGPEKPADTPHGPAYLKKQFALAAEWLKGDAAGLLPGMVTGDTTHLDGSLEMAMKTTGTTHLTAVSGANCSLILGGLVLLARSFGLSRGAAATVALGGLAAFVMMVGPDASVLRAAVMGGIGLTALSSGRRGRSLGYLCLAVACLLILDPSLGRSVGFLLSVLATLGIVLLARPMASWAPAWVPRWLASGVAVPLAAQLLCSPVLVALQPQFSSYSLLTNIAVAPFVAPVTILGTLAVPLVPLLPWLAVVPMAGAGASAGMVAAIARFFAGLPGAALPWPEGPAGIATMTLWSVLSILTVWLVLHPTWVGAAVLSLHRHLAFLIAAAESAVVGAGPAEHGRLGTCEKPSGRKHHCPLPRPPKPKPLRRTPSAGGTSARRP